MMFIDMTAQLGSLITGIQVMLLIAASAVGLSIWRGHTSVETATHYDIDQRRNLAIVGTSPSVPAKVDVTPSDSSVPEAA